MGEVNPPEMPSTILLISLWSAGAALYCSRWMSLTAANRILHCGKEWKCRSGPVCDIPRVVIGPEQLLHLGAASMYLGGSEVVVRKMAAWAAQTLSTISMSS